jgi:hypothetical protein
MFKQFLISIFLGALLGFILTTTYFYTKHNDKILAPKKEEVRDQTENIPKEKNTETIEISETIEQENTSTIFLDILTPQNESIVEKEELTISGTTTPNSVVVVNTISDIVHSTSSESGEFDIDIKLESGINILHVTTIDNDDNQLEKEILVTYSTAKI